MKSKPNKQRAGSTVVEFAMVSPGLFLVVLGSIEISRALMGVQCLEEAARSGCRVAVLRGATTEEIESEVDRLLAPTGISSYTVTTNPTNVAAGKRWEPITVRVTASLAAMSWVPLPQHVGGHTFTSACTLPREYSSE